MPIRPILITGPEIAKDTITPQFNENSFRKENLFNPPILPPKISPSPEPIIQIQVLPVKTMAETFGNGSVVDEITDGEILDWLLLKFKEDYFIIKEIIRCESHWDIDVVSPTGDVGLAQINLSAHWSEIPGETREEKIAWLQNPFHNIDFAHTLHLTNGWDDWGTEFTEWGSWDCWSKNI